VISGVVMYANRELGTAKCVLFIEASIIVSVLVLVIEQAVHV
jgi:hypothetical protein